MKSLYPFYFLLTTPLTNCRISLGEVFLSAVTTVTETATDININSSGWIATIKPNTYPDATPAIIATQEVPICLTDLRSDQTIESTAELTNAISVEKAAPRAP